MPIRRNPLSRLCSHSMSYGTRSYGTYIMPIRQKQSVRVHPKLYIEWRAVIKSSSRRWLDGNPGYCPADSSLGRMFIYRACRLNIRFCRDEERLLT